MGEILAVATVALVALLLLWVKLVDDSNKRAWHRIAMIEGLLLARGVMKVEDLEKLNIMMEDLNANQTNQT